MKNKIIFYFLFLCTMNAFGMEEKNINYNKSLINSTLYKKFIEERNELLMQLQEIWLYQDVLQEPGHKIFFKKLQEIREHDKMYQNISLNKEFQHSIIERNRQAISSHPK